ncbi:MAG: hypothetical protein KBC84_09150 [Proteobacteria bacterium]|nr:hypothetical protein [Pseudomonadota bacterium]
MSSERNNSNRSTLSTALTEAQDIIRAAEERAKEITTSAKDAYDDSIKQGYQLGYDKGMIKATKEAIRLIQEQDKVNQKLSEEAAKLAVAICSTIISEQITISPDIIVGIAKKAIKQSMIGEKVTIIANPDDLASLNNALPNISLLASGTKITLEGNDKISRGGCVVRTDFGEVDATVEVLIDSIKTNIGIKP